MTRRVTLLLYSWAFASLIFWEFFALHLFLVFFLCAHECRGIIRKVGKLGKIRRLGEWQGVGWVEQGCGGGGGRWGGVAYQIYHWRVKSGCISFHIKSCIPWQSFNISCVNESPNWNYYFNCFNCSQNFLIIINHLEFKGKHHSEGFQNYLFHFCILCLIRRLFIGLANDTEMTQNWIHKIEISKLMISYLVIFSTSIPVC